MVVGAAPAPPLSKKAAAQAKKAAAAAPPAPLGGVAANGKTEVPSATSGTSGKPDKAAYDKSQEKLKKEIDVLQAKVNAIKARLGPNGAPPALLARKTALRAQLDGLRSQQASAKGSRGKTLDQVKVLQENMNKKIKELNEKRSGGFKSVAEVDAKIKELEKGIESGSMKLVDEKKALMEISQLKKSRKNVDSLLVLQQQIDADRAQIETVRSGLDNPEHKSVNQQYDDVKKELDEIQKELDKASKERDSVWEERTVVMKELDELYTQKKEEANKFREDNNKFYQKQQEDRARRIEKQRSERAAYELSKTAEVNQKLLEEAQAPAFEREIEDCSTLIGYFKTRFLGGAPEEKKGDAPKGSILAGVKELSIRTVEAAIPTGGFIAKRKGEDEEEYFVGGGGKKNKKGAKKAGGAVESPKEVSGDDKVVLPFATLGALSTLGIQPPLTRDEVNGTVEKLELKKKYFVDNQDRVTKEKIAAVEKKIKAAELKAAAASSTPGTGEATPAAAEEEPEAEKVKDAEEEVAAE